MKYLFWSVCIVAGTVVTCWFLWLLHLESRVDQYREQLNEYVPSASESETEYCQRVFPMWQKTRDLINF